MPGMSELSAISKYPSDISYSCAGIEYQTIIDQSVTGPQWKGRYRALLALSNFKRVPGLFINRDWI